MIYLAHSISDFDHSNCNTLEQILALPGDSVITFDGVYKSVYDNWEALKHRADKIILFVVGDMIGKDNAFDHGRHFHEQYCTWEQILEMKKDGATIGWHTWTHPDLTVMPEAVVRREMTKPGFISLFAYPYGRFTAREAKIAQELGYSEAFSVFEGDNSQYQRLRAYIAK